MKNRFLFIKIAGISLIAILLLGYVTFQISRSRTFQFFGTIINRVDTDENVIALTFDDSPTEYTEDVLNILAERNINATFYSIGQSIEKYPDVTKMIVQQGHELGNHSYSHARFLLKSQSFIKNEIEKTNELIREAGYEGEITFRPPNGKKLFGLPWYLSQNNIKTITWDIEPDTYFNEDADAIKQYVLENVKPGSIILMHPFCKTACEADREALPEIIDELKNKGYSFVTVSQLLKY
jgi:chitin deacetylase